MSWFNLYKKWIPVYNEDGTLQRIDLIDDLSLVTEAQKFLEYCEQNKGKNVKVMDDWTGNELSEAEITRLENRRHRTPKVKQNVRKQIPAKIRTQIYELYNSKCAMCGDSRANQIHHIDGNCTNNLIENLQLVCHPCHIEIEGKTPFNRRLTNE